MISRKIIALGGGEIGRPGYPVETTRIDKEIIRLTGKKHPKLLFLPTASEDSESYYEVVKKHFGKRLGCKTNVLYLSKKLTKQEIKNKILKSDIIYVGGGNTLRMLRRWRKHSIDKLLKKALKKGIVMSGLSAGSVCWFKYGNCDSWKMANQKHPLIKLKCLNFIPALHCPHYNKEKTRKSSLKKMMKTTSGIAIALDNCCAIEIINNKYRIIYSKPRANAYKVYWKKGKFFQEKIKKTKTFQNLKNLLKK